MNTEALVKVEMTEVIGAVESEGEESSEVERSWLLKYFGISGVALLE
jgi:hypothetical protein